MRNVKSKYFLPIGISVLAALAVSGPLSAQDLQTDQPELILPDMGSEGTPDPATNVVIDLPEAEQSRVLDESIDPLVREAVEDLDRLGVIGRQARIGEDILVIDREIARADAIKRLIAYLGVDGFRLKYPELAAQIENSPLLLEADLVHLKLQNDIEVAKRGPEKPAKEAVPVPRDDGSSFFEQTEIANPPGPDGAPGTIDPALAAMIAEQVKKSTADAILAEKAKNSELLQVNLPISLREVYGTPEGLTAVITHGGERIRIRVGDTLPNNTEVLKIEQDSITILRNGASVKIDIHG